MRNKISAVTVVTMQGTESYWVGVDGVTRIVDVCPVDGLYFNEYHIYCGTKLLAKLKNVPVHVRYNIDDAGDDKQ